MLHSDSSESPSPRIRRDPQNDWSDNVIDILERIRENSIRLSEQHRRRFFHFKGFSKYFDIPVLVLSVLGSSFAVGMQSYIQQSTISAVSCIIGVIVSIITSIKLYLSIETSMQNELKMSKNFYSLSIEVYRVLRLSTKERGENGITYLHKSFATYSKLMEESNLATRAFLHDKLTQRIDHIDVTGARSNRKFGKRDPRSPIPIEDFEMMHVDQDISPDDPEEI